MNYAQLLKEICTNALLHLEFHKLAEKPKYITTLKRNVILGQYLKARLKQPRYKAVKKDIKTLILLSKKATANVEVKIEALLLLEVPTVSNELDAFYYLVQQIESDWNMPMMMIDPKSVTLSHDSGKTLLLPTDDISSHFDENSNLVKPINIVFRGSKTHESNLLIALDSSPFSYDNRKDRNEFNYVTLCS